MEFQRFEVAWYRKHGKYPTRIRKTKTGEDFVIGDWWWNQPGKIKCQYCGRVVVATEYVEKLINHAWIAHNDEAESRSNQREGVPAVGSGCAEPTCTRSFQSL